MVTTRRKSGRGGGKNEREREKLEAATAAKQLPRRWSRRITEREAKAFTASVSVSDGGSQDDDDKYFSFLSTCQGFTPNSEPPFKIDAQEAKRVKLCEKLTEVVTKVADSLNPATIPLQSTPHTQNSEYNTFAAACLATVPKISAEEPPPQVKIHSQAASGRSPLRRAKRVPCTRDKSTAEKGFAKKEIHEEGNVTHIDAPVSEGNIELNPSAIHVHVEGPEEIHPISPVQFPLEAANKKLISNINEDIHEASCRRSSEAHSNVRQATSINLTEMAQLMDDDGCSFTSKLNESLVTVNGYRVKEELAPILRDILSKYGDIASNCSKKSFVLRSMMLESVCDIVQKLQTTEFLQLTTIEVEGFLVLVKDIESDDMEVGWLRQRLDEIHEAQVLLKGFHQLKQIKSHARDVVVKVEREIEAQEEELCRLQEKINSLKEKRMINQEDEEKVDERLAHTKALVKRFQRGSMVDGLI